MGWSRIYPIKATPETEMHHFIESDKPFKTYFIHSDKFLIRAEHAYHELFIYFDMDVKKPIWAAVNNAIGEHHHTIGITQAEFSEFMAGWEWDSLEGTELSEPFLTIAAKKLLSHPDLIKSQLRSGNWIILRNTHHFADWSMLTDMRYNVIESDGNYFKVFYDYIHLISPEGKF